MNYSTNIRDEFENSNADGIRELDEWVRQEMENAAGCEYIADRNVSWSGAVQISARLRS